MCANIILYMEANKRDSSKVKDDIAKYLSCRSCGLQFDNLGDLQRHITTEHHQKGDVAQ